MDTVIQKKAASFGVQLSVREHRYPDSCKGSACRVAYPTLTPERFRITLPFSGPKAKATRIPEPADSGLDEERGEALLGRTLISRFGERKFRVRSGPGRRPTSWTHDQGFPAAWGQLASARPGGVREWRLLARITPR